MRRSDAGGVAPTARRRKLTEILRGSAVSEAVVQIARQLSPEDLTGADAAQRYVIGQLIDNLHRPWDALQTWFENLPVAMFCLLLLNLYGILLAGALAGTAGAALLLF